MNPIEKLKEHDSNNPGKWFDRNEEYLKELVEFSDKHPDDVKIYCANAADSLEPLSFFERLKSIFC